MRHGLRRNLVFLALLLLPCAVSAAETVSVEDVRVWAAPERTRVVFDLSDPVEHRLFSLSEPERVVLDLQNADFSVSGIPAGEGVIEGIRTGRRENNDLRVVLDLAQDAQPSSFSAAPNEEYGHRLVVDLETGDSEQVAREATAEIPRGDGRPLVIAIDPGHGGEDPGAQGPAGTLEKDVVMAIARQLERQIEAEEGMEPFLVRTGDYFLPLRERVQRARGAEADMFISIHADSFPNPSARGASVYALSQQGATHEAAERLADRENAADLIGGVRLSDKDETVASVLMDLSQSASISASLDAGDRLIEQMQGDIRLHRAEVMQAGFAVLKAPDIPSLLVEAAFISNPQEEQMLNRSEYQRDIANRIRSGVREYFWDNPIPGTRIAEMVRNGEEPGGGGEHTIARGETLSAIADRYGVSVQRLRRANGLNGDRIHPGQTLDIPSDS